MPSTIFIHVIPAFSDNYFYVLRDEDHNITAAVDPGDATPVRAFLQARGWSLDTIFCTHHHADHIGGVRALADQYHPDVYGYGPDAHRLPPLTHPLADGDIVAWGSHTCRVLAVPGHTLGHIAYDWPQQKTMFVGDTLFSLGCGRMFEGDPEGLWASLKILRARDDETLAYAAHEYTLANLRFALAADPDNADLISFGRSVEDKRARNIPTMPMRLGDEKLCNPFLRCDNEDFKARHGFTGKSDAAFFGFLRHWKDQF